MNNPLVTALLVLLVALVACVVALLIKLKRLKAHNSKQVQNNTKFEKLFEQSSDAMILINDGVYVAVNTAAVTLFGYPDIQALLTTKAGSIAPTYQYDGELSLVKMADYLKQANTTGSARFEWQSKRLNGEIIWLEIVITGIEFKNDTALHMICRNIHEKKSLESLNKQKNKELSKSNQELAHTINDLKQTRDRLVAAQKMIVLGDLVAGVAHEINTPVGISLTGISRLNEITIDLYALFNDQQLTKDTLKNYLDKSRTACDLTILNLKRAAF